MNKIAIKEINKSVQIEGTKRKYRTDCVKDYIGKDNYVQFISLNATGTLLLGVDDEGLMKKMPTNFFIHTSHPCYPIQVVVGTAVFLRVKPVDEYAESIWDLELEDITNEDLDAIEKMLDDQMQEQLKGNFKDYEGGGITVVKL